MDFDNSPIYDILSTILSYLTIIHSFELILLLLSMLIVFKIIFLAASTGLLHIHLIRLVQITGTLYMISVYFRMAMIIGKFLEIENLGKDLNHKKIRCRKFVVGWCHLKRKYRACIAQYRNSPLQIHPSK